MMKAFAMAGGAGYSTGDEREGDCLAHREPSRISPLSSREKAAHGDIAGKKVHAMLRAIA